MKIWQRRLLGILSIGGGGTGFTITLVSALGQRTLMAWVLCAVFLGLFAWGIWCGVRVLEAHPDAVRSLRRFWIAQVPVIATPWVSYTLACGFHATVRLKLAPLAFDANFALGSTFNGSLLQYDPPTQLGVNLFALAIVIWLGQLGRVEESPGKPAVIANEVLP
jgi:hypothetical protein